MPKYHYNVHVISKSDDFSMWVGVTLDHKQLPQGDFCLDNSLLGMTAIARARELCPALKECFCEEWNGGDSPYTFHRPTVCPECRDRWHPMTYGTDEYQIDYCSARYHRVPYMTRQGSPDDTSWVCSFNKEFIMGNNEMMAMANAREIEKLPYETLKAMFPSVRYMVQGEKWHRKFIGHRTNETTGKEETYAAGEWRADLNGKSFDNPLMAHLWAEMEYSKGHFKVYAFVPELHKVSNQIVNE